MIVFSFAKIIIFVAKVVSLCDFSRIMLNIINKSIIL